MTIVISFLNYYGAISFKKKYPTSLLQPVPRVLSSSCGTCAVLKDTNEDFFKDELGSFNIEAVYKAENDKYIKIDLPKNN